KHVDVPDIQSPPTPSAALKQSLPSAPQRSTRPCGPVPGRRQRPLAPPPSGRCPRFEPVLLAAPWPATPWPCPNAHLCSPCASRTTSSTPQRRTPSSAHTRGPPLRRQSTTATPPRPQHFP